MFACHILLIIIPSIPGVFMPGSVLEKCVHDLHMIHIAKIMDCSFSGDILSCLRYDIIFMDGSFSGDIFCLVFDMT